MLGLETQDKTIIQYNTIEFLSRLGKKLRESNGKTCNGSNTEKCRMEGPLEDRAAPEGTL